MSDEMTFNESGVRKALGHLSSAKGYVEKAIDKLDQAASISFEIITISTAGPRGSSDDLRGGIIKENNGLISDISNFVNTEKRNELLSMLMLGENGEVEYPEDQEDEMEPDGTDDLEDPESLEGPDEQGESNSDDIGDLENPDNPEGPQGQEEANPDDVGDLNNPDNPEMSNENPGEGNGRTSIPELLGLKPEDLIDGIYDYTTPILVKRNGNGPGGFVKDGKKFVLDNDNAHTELKITGKGTDTSGYTVKEGKTTEGKRTVSGITYHINENSDKLVVYFTGGTSTTGSFNTDDTSCLINYSPIKDNCSYIFIPPSIYSRDGMPKKSITYTDENGEEKTIQNLAISESDSAKIAAGVEYVADEIRTRTGNDDIEITSVAYSWGRIRYKWC